MPGWSLENNTLNEESLARRIFLRVGENVKFWNQLLRTCQMGKVPRITFLQVILHLKLFNVSNSPWLFNPSLEPLIPILVSWVVWKGVVKQGQFEFHGVLLRCTTKKLEGEC